MRFLRNEFSKVIGDLFTMTLFRIMTHIYDQTKIYKLKVGEILKVVGCKMSSRKVKLNGTPESHPTAWGLNKQISKLAF